METLRMEGAPIEAATAPAGRRRSWGTAVVRAVARGGRAVGRALAQPGVLWWLGVPWTTWPPPSTKGDRR